MDHGQRTSKTNYAYNNTSPTQATIDLHQPRVNSVSSGETYDHTKPMENTHQDTHIIVTQEWNIEDAEFEQEEIFEYTNENMTNE